MPSDEVAGAPSFFFPIHAVCSAHAEDEPIALDGLRGIAVGSQVGAEDHVMRRSPHIGTQPASASSRSSLHVVYSAGVRTLRKSRGFRAMLATVC